MADARFGERLRRAREAKGLERAEVAERLGISLATIQHHEGGRNEPTIAGILRYAAAYGVTVGWLMTGRGKGPGASDDPREAVYALIETVPEEQLPLLADVVRPFSRKNH